MLKRINGAFELCLEKIGEISSSTCFREGIIHHQNQVLTYDLFFLSFPPPHPPSFPGASLTSQRQLRHMWNFILNIEDAAEGRGGRGGDRGGEEEGGG